MINLSKFWFCCTIDQPGTAFPRHQTCHVQRARYVHNIVNVPTNLCVFKAHLEILSTYLLIYIIFTAWSTKLLPSVLTTFSAGNTTMPREIPRLISAFSSDTVGWKHKGHPACKSPTNYPQLSLWGTQLNRSHYRKDSQLNTNGGVLYVWSCDNVAFSLWHWTTSQNCRKYYYHYHYHYRSLAIFPGESR